MDVSSPIVFACCPRVGAPPLRFKGWSVARHQSLERRGRPDLYIELWKRQRGGYTAAYSRWIDGQWHPDALTAETLDLLILTLEEHCALLQDALFAAEVSWAQDFRHLALTRQQFVEFQHLVGHALYDWDELQATSAQAIPALAQSS